jgi:hypothetical protein
MTREQREKLLTRLSDSLPTGWSVSQVIENQVPDGWRTFDTRTLGIEGKNGDRRFHLWIVPEDWIGIREQKPAGGRYGPEVFVHDQFKMIVHGDYALYQILERWRLISARGWKRSTGRESPPAVARVEEQTRALVERFCSNQACRDEAAYSLIILGSATRTLTLDCAEHGTGEPQESCLGLLPEWPGPETLQTLHRVLSHKSTDPTAVKAAAWAVRLIGGNEASGPALLEALKNTAGGGPENVLVDALAETRYQPAAPEILTRLERTSSDFKCTLQCAKALAALRYSPAIPAIQKLARTKDISSEWLLEQQRLLNSIDLNIPEVALLRLTAPWGPPVKGVRLLLIPPVAIPASGNIQLAGLLENESKVPNGLLFEFTFAAMIVDGKVYARRPFTTWDGPVDLPINSVFVRSFELPDEVLDGNTHRIQIRAASAVSNEIVLTVPRR